MPRATFSSQIEKIQKPSRVRHARDAEYLARLRFLRKAPRGAINKHMTWSQARSAVEKHTGLTYRAWKGRTSSRTLREAQHIIPASLGIKYAIPNTFINSAENGIMLQAGHRGGMLQNQITPEYAKYKGTNTSYKKKVMHIQKGIAHPTYNRIVQDRLEDMKDHKGRVSVANARKIAISLRTLHKLRTKKVLYADQIK